MKLFSLLLILSLAALLLGGYLFEGAQSSGGYSIIRVGGQRLEVELARTPEKRATGLSHREGLPKDGMLFVFDEPGYHAFWMKDMNFPIDIIWLDRDLKVVYIKENVKPESYPTRFTPPTPAQYVLETRAGFTSSVGLKIGNQARFSE